MKHLEAFHDSHENFYRSPFGAVVCNQEIVIRIKIDSLEELKKVYIKSLNSRGEEELYPMSCHQEIEGIKIYQAKIVAPSFPCLLHYFFVIETVAKNYYYGNNEESLGGKGLLKEEEPFTYQITVYKEEAFVPSWFKEGIIYQIFPDRFYREGYQQELLEIKKNSFIYGSWGDTPMYIREKDSNEILRWDFFGGNLLGIIKKLPYLKELGISVIYLNPIFISPSNHRYDISDYKTIDPLLGNNRLFKELCTAAEAMGIAIVLDGVFSHTGSDSIYFNKEGNYPTLGAYQSEESPYYSWYRFYEFPHSYDCWWGISNMPNVNEMEKSYIDFIIDKEDSVLKYWMNLGAKGWRLDVADELPDAFIKKFKKVMREVDQDAVLIGEVWEDASNKVSYGEKREYLLGEELDSVMNYPFREALVNFFTEKISVEYFNRRLMSLYENYPKAYFYSMMNLIGSHDVPRILTLLGEQVVDHQLTQGEREKQKLNAKERGLAVRRLKLLVLFQMTFPGVPSIYYGDEVGMEGLEDPLNRGTYPWGRGDEDLLQWYKKIISLRNGNDVFKSGEWLPLYSCENIYGFIRKNHDQESVILFNRSRKEESAVSIDIGSKIESNHMKDVLYHDEKIYIKNRNMKITLKPLEGKIFIGDKN
ncbi:glycoside hydrolase family 13 protein [Clostridium formicaceticum]|uniref:Alpha-glycosidase n=1 Tax=Clostridium formicaceticum TaxID=1497 RepID=A0AAC9WI07_9CLOT|nr:glycoside hydrolase family 13 protein [Clostridium formicaceticum]AOY74890.1 alpha-glycosidase [Clostridium formicaceticum]ARE89294.1 Amylopullulanase precursor [Clostridium formicaceticum]